MGRVHCIAVEEFGDHHNVIHDSGAVGGSGRFWEPPGPVWLHQPQKVTLTLKSHMDGHLNFKKSPQLQKSHHIPKKSKKSKKVKKNPIFFFLGPFCYKNVEKMFYQTQKVIFSPQKVKKVKKNFFIFHILCKKKSQLYIYFWFWAPMPHLKIHTMKISNFSKKYNFHQINPKYV